MDAAPDGAAVRRTRPTRNTATTAEEICQAGLDALVCALGPVGMIRFLQQFETGRGDYTTERQRRAAHARPGEVLTLADELMREQAEGKLGRPQPLTIEP